MIVVDANVDDVVASDGLVELLVSGRDVVLPLGESFDLIMSASVVVVVVNVMLVVSGGCNKHETQQLVFCDDSSISLMC